MIKKKKRTRQIFTLFLALLLIFEVTGTVFAARPFGDNPQEHFNYYVEVNEEYESLKWERKDTMYGYGIYGQNVASHEVVYGEKKGQHEDRTYNIEFASDTPGNVSFDLVFDVNAGSGIPLINNVPGLTGFSRIVNNNDDLILGDPEEGIHGTPVELKNGKAQLTLYVYADPFESIPTIHNFNFTIADADTSDDPNPDDVKSISITTPPERTTYTVGENFGRAGMVVTATLTDGSQVPVAGYKVEPEGPLTLGTDKVIISFGAAAVEQAITVISSTDIENVQIKNGQMLSDYEWIVDSRRLEKLKNTYNAVVHYGEKKGVFIFFAGKNVEVYIEEEKQAVNEDGLCTLSLPTSVEGTATVVTVKSGEEQANYTFNCYSQAVRGLPTAVTDYLCIASQYTNGNGLGPYGVNAAATLRGTGFDTTTGWTEKGPTSLGNFGGYITYYYEEPIKDDPKNPYGVDFIVTGNSVNGGGEFAEPGNVLVSEDGKNWCTLAGSLHYDNAAIWDYEITYRNDDGRAAWTDNQGNSGTSYYYPLKMYYSLFPWKEGDEEQVTFSGVMLNPEEGTNEWGNTVPPFAEFGYADVGDRSDKASIHPYKGISEGIKNQQDSFDLKWAVDEKGHPIQFPNGIHYVKVQTANNIDNGAIGEKSTEVSAVRGAQPASDPVGQTGAPGSITVDESEIQIEEGKEVYDATVSGAFNVEVNTDAENTYINSSKGDSVEFSQMPNHQMLRIIVQDGEKEPWIGYVNLTEGEPNDDVKAAKAVDDLIDKIGDSVTLEDEQAIADARKAYDALSKEQRELVTKLEDLESAEAQISNLKAVKEVEDMIAAIGKVTLESKPAIDKARDAYDDLSEIQKDLVSNYSTFLEAEASYEALLNDKTDEEAAKEVDDMIDKISDLITLKDKEDIQRARAAHNILSEEQKELVTKLKQLEVAEQKLKELEDEVSDVMEKINDLPDKITLADKDKIEEALMAYNALAKEQQALVSNIDTLNSAKDKIDYLEEDKDNGKDDKKDDDGKDDDNDSTKNDDKDTQKVDNKGGKETTKSPKSAKTGDDFMPVFWMSILGISAIGLFVIRKRGY